MRRTLIIAAAAAVLVAGVITLIVSGGSSKSADQVRVQATPTFSPSVHPTHRPPIKRTPSPTRPTVHIAPPASQPPRPIACRVSPGVHAVDGREVIVDLPTRFPAPVVIDFHGGNQTAVQEHGYTGLGPAGASRGFIVVTPNGTHGLWNFTGSEPLPNDVAFTQDIAATLAEAGCSNGRLYTAGISDGADMAVAAACRISGVRAVFAVAPSITPRSPCVRKSYLEVHGTADPIVPYSGSAPGSFADVPSQPVLSRLPYWTSGCAGPAQGASPGSNTSVQRWTCAARRTVQLDTVSGGGHTWPGAVGNEPVAGLGPRAAWSADLAALTFFAAN
jgi:polyhydroxybutyrate depolymerase